MEHVFLITMDLFTAEWVHPSEVIAIEPFETGSIIYLKRQSTPKVYLAANPERVHYALATGQSQYHYQFG
jgi:hypothetical protein